MVQREGVSGPVVVAANWYAFRPGEVIRHERVMSRCFLWVVEGGGTVRSGGSVVALRTGMVLVLPWAHDVEYCADRSAPFRLGTVHVVPEHRRDAPVVPRVAHLPGDPLFKGADRSAGDDAELRVAAPLISGAAVDASRRLADLGRYVVQRYIGADFDEELFRALGELMVAEGRDLATVRQGASNLPVAVQLMTDFVSAHLRMRLSVSDVAQAGGCSTSTAGRLFSKHLGSSVASWVRSTRMREAATLLRTTSLRVGEVGRAVGYEDQLYFSRVFKETYGMAPSTYAAGVLRP